MFRETKNCIICGKKAHTVFGHVHRGREILLAGLCKAHENEDYARKPRKDCAGCCGEWKIRDGVFSRK